MAGSLALEHVVSLYWEQQACAVLQPALQRTAGQERSVRCNITSNVVSTICELYAGHVKNFEWEKTAGQRLEILSLKYVEMELVNTDKNTTVDTITRLFGESLFPWTEAPIDDDNIEGRLVRGLWYSVAVHLDQESLQR